MTHRDTLKKEFEELFRTNYSRLFYCALDFVEDAETAKDLVSDLFSDAWPRYSELKNENIEAYLYRSIRNRSLNYLKHREVVNRYQETYLAEKEYLITDDPALHEARLKLIETTMETLTPQTRNIFEQCYFEGKKYQEMAEVLSVSVSAIHKHMNKAFATFRKAFEDHKLTPR